MDLITLDEYKSYKDIKNPTKDDIYQAIISAVSDLIKAYCGRTFIDHYYEPKTELFSVKPGMNAVFVSEIPINVISGVSSENVDITTNTAVDTEIGGVYTVKDYFRPGPDILSITYTGGYPETPASIKLACFELVDYYANGEHTARKSFGGTSVEYQQTVNEWPFHIQAVLDMYRDL